MPFIGMPFMPSPFGQKYREGLIRDGGRQTIITRGIGHLVAPVRFTLPRQKFKAHQTGLQIIRLPLTTESRWQLIPFLNNSVITHCKADARLTCFDRQESAKSGHLLRMILYCIGPWYTLQCCSKPKYVVMPGTLF